MAAAQNVIIATVLPLCTRPYKSPVGGRPSVGVASLATAVPPIPTSPGATLVAYSLQHLAKQPQGVRL